MELDKKSNETLTLFCDGLKKVLGDNLSSIVLYGSAVRNEMVEGRSDINVMIVLAHSTPEAHRAVAAELRPFPKIAPFVLSRGELPRSRTVFALKFRSIGRNYRVLYGEDPLAGFAPSDDLMRFLCEQSLRNLRLRLKHSYITNTGKPDRYRQALVASVPSIFVSLSEALRSAAIEVPNDYPAKSAAIGNALAADASVLDDLLKLKASPEKLSADDAFQYHARLFRLLSDALDWVRQQWPLEADAK